MHYRQSFQILFQYMSQQVVSVFHLFLRPERQQHFTFRNNFSVSLKSAAWFLLIFVTALFYFVSKTRLCNFISGIYLPTYIRSWKVCTFVRILVYFHSSVYLLIQIRRNFFSSLSHSSQNQPWLIQTGFHPLMELIWQNWSNLLEWHHFCFRIFFRFL